VNDANGVKVTTPDESTTYDPTFGTLIVDPAATVQLFGVCAGVVVGLHNRNVDTDNVAPDPAASFVNRFFVCAVLYAPLDVSAPTVGNGTTLGVIVAETTLLAESVT
jgi:hypothetical protein